MSVINDICPVTATTALSSATSTDSDEPNVLDESLSNQIISSQHVETVPRKRKRSYEDSDEGMLCPVCFDTWTSNGSHRLISLKCGHLFGLSCVERWFTTNKSCPTCNGRAKKGDIREIYASKLVALDTADLENARRKIRNLEQDNARLQSEIGILKSTNLIYKNQLNMAKRDINSDYKLEFPKLVGTFNPKLVRSLRLEEGACRVLAYCRARQIIAVSQEKISPLWPGFGVRLFSAHTANLAPHLPMHKKEMRDLAFHPTNQDILLSVAFDNEVKVLDITENKLTFNWKGDQQIWCACWDYGNNFNAFVGTGRGHVYRLSMCGSSPVLELPFPVNNIQQVPVVALKASRRLNCILCCRLLSLTAYLPLEDTYDPQVIEIGRYSGMAFIEDEKYEPTVVLCYKPSEGQPRVRYVCYRLELSEAKVKMTQLQVILGGEQATQLTRPCLLAGPAGIMFIAFFENLSSVCGWNVGTDQKAFAVKTNNFVRDVLAVPFNENFCILILTSNNLKLYSLL